MKYDKNTKTAKAARAAIALERDLVSLKKVRSASEARVAVIKAEIAAKAAEERAITAANANATYEASHRSLKIISKVEKPIVAPFNTMAAAFAKAGLK